MAGEARTDLVCDPSLACLVEMSLTGTGLGTRVVTVEEGCNAKLLGEVKLHWTVSIRVISNATTVIHLEKACMKSSECSLHESSLVR